MSETFDRDLEGGETLHIYVDGNPQACKFEHTPTGAVVRISQSEGAIRVRTSNASGGTTAREVINERTVGSPDASNVAGEGEMRDITASSTDQLTPGETSGPADVGARNDEGIVVPSKEKESFPATPESQTPEEGSEDVNTRTEDQE